jgi:hypothetical protein
MTGILQILFASYAGPIPLPLTSLLSLVVGVGGRTMVEAAGRVVIVALLRENLLAAVLLLNLN